MLTPTQNLSSITLVTRTPSVNSQLTIIMSFNSVLLAVLVCLLACTMCIVMETQKKKAHHWQNFKLCIYATIVQLSNSSPWLKVMTVILEWVYGILKLNTVKVHAWPGTWIYYKWVYKRKEHVRNMYYIIISN